MLVLKNRNSFTPAPTRNNVSSLAKLKALFCITNPTLNWPGGAIYTKIIMFSFSAGLSRTSLEIN